MNKKAKDKKKVYAPRNEDVHLLFYFSLPFSK